MAPLDAGTERVAIAAARPRWWPLGAGIPAPNHARGGAGERRRNRYSVRQHDGALGPRSPRSCGRRSRAFEPWPTVAAWPLSARDLRANHQVWRLPPPQQETCGAAWKPPARWEPGTLQPRRPPCALPAQQQTGRGANCWVQQRPGQPATTAGALERGGGPLHSRNRKSSGPVALLPQGGELIRAEQEGLALRTLPPRPDSSAGACPAKPRSQPSFLSGGRRRPVGAPLARFRRFNWNWCEPGRRPARSDWQRRGWWLAPHRAVADAGLGAVGLKGSANPGSRCCPQPRGPVLQRRPLGLGAGAGGTARLRPHADACWLALRHPAPHRRCCRSAAPQAQAALNRCHRLELHLARQAG